jgi:hypothetical protein
MTCRIQSGSMREVFTVEENTSPDCQRQKTSFRNTDLFLQYSPSTEIRFAERDSGVTNTRTDLFESPQTEPS